MIEECTVFCKLKTFRREQTFWVAHGSGRSQITGKVPSGNGDEDGTAVQVQAGGYAVHSKKRSPMCKVSNRSCLFQDLFRPRRDPAIDTPYFEKAVHKRRSDD